MKYFIITGTSRGLGEALANQLLQQDHTIFCLSRKQNNKLKDLANEKGTNLYYFSCDLQKFDEVEKIIDRIFSTIDFEAAEGVYLINNAGTVDPIKPIGKANSKEITSGIQVNLIAPMVLSNAFIHYTSNLATNKMIVNISSGAANRTTYGWGTYSTSKAGLDMFTKSVALEQEKELHPVTIISFSPGVMDTEMQEVIRESDEEDFTEVNRFREFKDQGMLRSPQLVADVILNLIKNERPINGYIYDIKSFLK